jgi:7,8-dihydropterin-6-yl-methyl-4-(beta-D-ribofuranosyl)aminobenzene 5'-phosphate synthase
LGIDPTKLDALVLSQGDYGHFGGLVGFLRQRQGRLKASAPGTTQGKAAPLHRPQGLPLFARMDRGAGQRNLGVLNRKALDDLIPVTYAERPSLATAFATPQIGFNIFEKAVVAER